MRIPTNARTERFLADLDHLDDKLDRVQRSISSGYRVNRPSDDPSQIIDILQLKSEVQRADGISTNMARVTAETDTAEAAVRVGVQLLERARTIAAQTATDTATNRQGIALEIRQIHEQLVNLTKTMSEGRYIFSGDQDQTVLYAADWTQAGGVSQLATATNTRRLEDINGTSFSVYRTASQVFDDRDGLGAFTANNAFNAVYKLGKALEADDRTAVEAASKDISSALDHVGRELTFYGNAQNRLTDSSNMALKAKGARIRELSARRDTDMAQAIVDLSTVKVHREAALGAEAQQPRTSLFNYLG